MLFIEKFQYNPGLDDFPNIYIKDPQVGILYELEDLGEVKNNSVLALNVEGEINFSFFSPRRKELDKLIFFAIKG